jgi:TPR repeat protein
MLADGRGGPCGTAAALDLFEKAAAEGHSGAMFALGALYAGGHDLPEDRMTAQRWFRAAAELGHGQAQLMLGRYLAEGVAGEPNPAEARSWFEQAAAQGIEEAQADLAALRGNPAIRAGLRFPNHCRGSGSAIETDGHGMRVIRNHRILWRGCTP